MKRIVLSLATLVFSSSCSNSTFEALGPDWVRAWERGSRSLSASDDVVRISGSSTCAPIFWAISYEFERAGYASALDVEAIGTDAGVDRFIRFGEVDVVMASRSMTAQELERAGSNGRTVVSLPLAVDALTLVVSPRTDFVRSLSLNQVRQAFSEARTWDEISPDFPKILIYHFAQGRQSGSTDFFVDRVLGTTKEAFLSTERTQNSEDDSILVRAIEDTVGGIGYLGYSEWKKAVAPVVALDIQGVRPEPKTVVDGTYPLSRPLTIYTTDAVLRTRPNVLAVLIYLYAHYERLIEEAGFIAVDSMQLGRCREALAPYLILRDS